MRSDLLPFKHGDEGTHYACNIALAQGNGCCGCNRHDCPEESAEGYLEYKKPMEGVHANDLIDQLVTDAELRGIKMGRNEKIEPELDKTIQEVENELRRRLEKSI